MDKVIISKGYNSLTGECSSELDTPPVKQIIDGVDVSECKYYCAKNDTGDAFDLTCTKENMPVFRCDRKSMKDCYYKQLKRKEQECEELKKQKEILLNQLIVYDGEDVTIQLSLDQFEEYNKLKAECERLKEENFILRERTINYSEYKEKQYEKALQEIREIANIIYNTNCNYVAESHNILTKINEVIGAE